MILSDLLYAAPAESWNIGQNVSTTVLQDPSKFEAPLDFSTLKEIRRGNAKTFIIHIQDAHANLSGQQNLAGALDALMNKYKIKLVLVEGGTKDDSLTAIKKLASPATWKRVAKKFLMEGKISGEEYLNLTSDHPMKIMGIEDKELYTESLNSYAELAGKREGILGQLSKLHIALEKLKKKTYPQELVKYEALKKKSEDFEAGFRELSGLAATLDKSSFPNVEALIALQQSETGIDFDAANLEQAALAQKISFKFAGPKHSKISQANHLKNLFDVARTKQVSLADYPELSKYDAYLRSFSEIDFDRLFDEMERLEDEVYRARLETEDAKLIRCIDRYAGLLDSAYRIQMSTKEFEQFKVNEPDYATTPMLAFVNAELAELGYFTDMLADTTVFDEGKKSLETFYGSVSRRDLAFIENAQRILKEEGEEIAVLIAGGYHTAHLKKLFQEKDYSYAVISPLVTSETNQAKYEKILLESVKKETTTVTTSLETDLKTLKEKTDSARAPAVAEAGARFAELIQYAAPHGNEESIAEAALTTTRGARAVVNDHTQTSELSQALSTVRTVYYPGSGSIDVSNMRQLSRIRNGEESGLDFIEKLFPHAEKIVASDTGWRSSVFQWIERMLPSTKKTGLVRIRQNWKQFRLQSGESAPGTVAVLIRRPRHNQEGDDLRRIENDVYLSVVPQMRTGDLLVVNDAVLPRGRASAENLGVEEIGRSGTPGSYVDYDETIGRNGPRKINRVDFVRRDIDSWVVYRKTVTGARVSGDPLRNNVIGEVREVFKQRLGADSDAFAELERLISKYGFSAINRKANAKDYAKSKASDGIRARSITVGFDIKPTETGQSIVDPIIYIGLPINQEIYEGLVHELLETHITASLMDSTKLAEQSLQQFANLDLTDWLVTSQMLLRRERYKLTPEESFSVAYLALYHGNEVLKKSEQIARILGSASVRPWFDTATRRLSISLNSPYAPGSVVTSLIAKPQLSSQEKSVFVDAMDRVLRRIDVETIFGARTAVAQILAAAKALKDENAKYVTRETIAYRAGVNPATVSRYMSDPDVKKAVDELTDTKLLTLAAIERFKARNEKISSFPDLADEAGLSDRSILRHAAVDKNFSQTVHAAISGARVGVIEWVKSLFGARYRSVPVEVLPDPNVKDTAAEDLVDVLGLGQAKAIDRLVSKKFNEIGVSVYRIHIDESVRPSPQSGLSVLLYELGGHKEYDLVYNVEGRLIAIMPAKISLGRPFYLDITPYLVPLGLLKDIASSSASHADWRPTLISWKRDVQALEDFKHFMGYRWHRSRHLKSSLQKTWMFVEAAPDGALWARRLDLDQLAGHSALTRRIFSRDDTSAKALFPDYPTVYPAAMFNEASGGGDRRFYESAFELAKNVKALPGEARIDAATGSGFVAWLQWQAVRAQKAEKSVRLYAYDIHPIAVANAKMFLQRIAGIPVELTVADSLDAFGDVSYRLVTANSPAHMPMTKNEQRQIDIALFSQRESFWDGASAGRNFTEGMAATLGGHLEQDGAAIFWNNLPQFSGEFADSLRNAGLRVKNVNKDDHDDAVYLVQHPMAGARTAGIATVGALEEGLAAFDAKINALSGKTMSAEEVRTFLREWEIWMDSQALLFQKLWTVDITTQKFLARRLTDVTDKATQILHRFPMDLVGRARMLRVRRLAWGNLGNILYTDKDSQGAIDAYLGTLDMELLPGYPTNQQRQEIKTIIRRLGPLWLAHFFVYRGGGLDRGLAPDTTWTVGDHVLTLLALLPYLVDKETGFSNGDFLAMVERVALHDADEIITGDVTPTDPERWANKEEVEAQARPMLLQLLERYKLVTVEIDRWGRKLLKYGRQQDVKSRFVKQADKLASQIESLAQAERFPGIRKAYLEIPGPTYDFHQWFDYEMKMTFGSLIAFFAELQVMRDELNERLIIEKYKSSGDETPRGARASGYRDSAAYQMLKNDPAIRILEGGIMGAAPADDVEDLDEVDESGEPTGAKADKRIVHRYGVPHRVAHIHVFDKKGNVLLQERTADKPISPGKLQVAASGHITVREKPEDGALREGSEELGISFDPKRLIRIAKPYYRSSKHTGVIDNQYHFVYGYAANDHEIEEIWKKYNRHEIERLYLISPSQFESLIAAHPELFSGTLQHLVDIESQLWARLKERFGYQAGARVVDKIISEPLWNRIKSEDGSPTILLIDGIRASGKTTFSGQFQEYLEANDIPTTLVRTRQFYRSAQPGSKIRFITVLTAVLSVAAFSLFFRVFPLIIKRWVVNAVYDTESLDYFKREIFAHLEWMGPGAVLIIEGTTSFWLFRDLPGAKRLYVSARPSVIRGRYIERQLRRKSGRGEEVTAAYRKKYDWLTRLIISHWSIRLLSAWSGASPDLILDLNDVEHPVLTETGVTTGSRTAEQRSAFRRYMETLGPVVDVDLNKHGTIHGNKNLPAGTIYALDLRGFADDPKKYKNIRLSFAALGSTGGSHPLIPDDLFEVLANAFVHGNGLDLTSPIYFIVNEDGTVIQVFDFDMDEQEKSAFKDEIPKARAAGLFGGREVSAGHGLKQIRRNWKYDKELIEVDGRKLGKKVVLHFKGARAAGEGDFEGLRLEIEGALENTDTQLNEEQLERILGLSGNIFAYEGIQKSLFAHKIMAALSSLLEREATELPGRLLKRLQKDLGVLNDDALQTRLSTLWGAHEALVKKHKAEMSPKAKRGPPRASGTRAALVIEIGNAQAQVARLFNDTVYAEPAVFGNADGTYTALMGGAESVEIAEELSAKYTHAPPHFVVHSHVPDFQARYLNEWFPSPTDFSVHGFPGTARFLYIKARPSRKRPSPLLIRYDTADELSAVGLARVAGKTMFVTWDLQGASASMELNDKMGAPVGLGVSYGGGRWMNYADALTPTAKIAQRFENAVLSGKYSKVAVVDVEGHWVLWDSSVSMASVIQDFERRATTSRTVTGSRLSIDGLRALWAEKGGDPAEFARIEKVITVLANRYMVEELLTYNPKKFERAEFYAEKLIGWGASRNTVIAALLYPVYKDEGRTKMEALVTASLGHESKRTFDAVLPLVESASQFLAIRFDASIHDDRTIPNYYNMMSQVLPNDQAFKLMLAVKMQQFTPQHASSVRDALVQEIMAAYRTAADWRGYGDIADEFEGMAHRAADKEQYELFLTEYRRLRSQLETPEAYNGLMQHIMFWRDWLISEGVDVMNVTFRIKSAPSTYTKITWRWKFPDLTSINDLIGVRMVVDDREKVFTLLQNEEARPMGANTEKKNFGLNVDTEMDVPGMPEPMSVEIQFLSPQMMDEYIEGSPALLSHPWYKLLDWLINHWRTVPRQRFRAQMRDFSAQLEQLRQRIYVPVYSLNADGTMKSFRVVELAAGATPLDLAVQMDYDVSSFRGFLRVEPSRGGEFPDVMKHPQDALIPALPTRPLQTGQMLMAVHELPNLVVIHIDKTFLAKAHVGNIDWQVPYVMMATGLHKLFRKDPTKRAFAVERGQRIFARSSDLKMDPSEMTMLLARFAIDLGLKDSSDLLAALAVGLYPEKRFSAELKAYAESRGKQLPLMHDNHSGARMSSVLPEVRELLQALTHSASTGEFFPSWMDKYLAPYRNAMSRGAVDIPNPRIYYFGDTPPAGYTAVEGIDRLYSIADPNRVWKVRDILEVWREGRDRIGRLALKRDWNAALAQRAFDIAFIAHQIFPKKVEDLFRKGIDVPAIVHPTDAAVSFMEEFSRFLEKSPDVGAFIAGLWHDIGEDSLLGSLSDEELVTLLGDERAGRKAVRMMRLLSKLKNEKDEEYLPRLIDSYEILLQGLDPEEALNEYHQLLLLKLADKASSLRHDLDMHLTESLSDNLGHRILEFLNKQALFSRLFTTFVFRSDHAPLQQAAIYLQDQYLAIDQIQRSRIDPEIGEMPWRDFQPVTVQRDPKDPDSWLSVGTLTGESRIRVLEINGPEWRQLPPSEQQRIFEELWPTLRSSFPKVWLKDWLKDPAYTQTLLNNANEPLTAVVALSDERVVAGGYLYNRRTHTLNVIRTSEKYRRRGIQHKLLQDLRERYLWKDGVKTLEMIALPTKLGKKLNHSGFLEVEIEPPTATEFEAIESVLQIGETVLIKPGASRPTAKRLSLIGLGGEEERIAVLTTAAREHFKRTVVFNGLKTKRRLRETRLRDVTVIQTVSYFEDPETRNNEEFEAILLTWKGTKPNAAEYFRQMTRLSLSGTNVPEILGAWEILENGKAAEPSTPTKDRHYIILERPVLSKGKYLADKLKEITHVDKKLGFALQTAALPAATAEGREQIDRWVRAIIAMYTQIYLRTGLFILEDSSPYLARVERTDQEWRSAVIGFNQATDGLPAQDTLHRFENGIYSAFGKDLIHSAVLQAVTDEASQPDRTALQRDRVTTMLRALRSGARVWNISADRQQGPRNYQDDRYFVGRVDLDGVQHGHGTFVFVADGFGGFRTVDRIEDDFKTIFEESLMAQQKAFDANESDEVSVERAYRDALRELIELTNDEESGSTLTSFYAPDDEDTGTVFAFGDSPATVRDADGKIILSPRHNVRTNLRERFAVFARGGQFVEGDRVKAPTAKDGEATQLTHFIGAAANAAIRDSDPDIYPVKLGKDSFILLGSDGIDSVPQDELIRLIDHGDDASSITAAAVKNMTNKDGDNVTAIIVRSVAAARVSLDSPVSILALDRRSENALLANGIKNLDQLIKYTRNELRKLRGMGKRSAQTIEQALTVHGLALKNEVDVVATSKVLKKYDIDLDVTMLARKFSGKVVTADNWGKWMGDIPTRSLERIKKHKTLKAADKAMWHGALKAAQGSPTDIESLEFWRQETIAEVWGNLVQSPTGKTGILIAHSGTGKSTLSHYLTTQGFKLLSDDQVNLYVHEGQIYGAGDFYPGTLKLTSGPAAGKTLVWEDDSFRQIDFLVYLRNEKDETNIVDFLQDSAFVRGEPNERYIAALTVPDVRRFTIELKDGAGANRFLMEAQSIATAMQPAGSRATDQIEYVDTPESKKYPYPITFRYESDETIPLSEDQVIHHTALRTKLYDDEFARRLSSSSLLGARSEPAVNRIVRGDNAGFFTDIRKGDIVTVVFNTPFKSLQEQGSSGARTVNFAQFYNARLVTQDSMPAIVALPLPVKTGISGWFTNNPGQTLPFMMERKPSQWQEPVFRAILAAELAQMGYQAASAYKTGRSSKIVRTLDSGVTPEEIEGMRLVKEKVSARFDDVFFEYRTVEGEVITNLTDDYIPSDAVEVFIETPSKALIQKALSQSSELRRARVFPVAPSERTEKEARVLPEEAVLYGGIYIARGVSIEGDELGREFFARVTGVSQFDQADFLLYQQPNASRLSAYFRLAVKPIARLAIDKIVEWTKVALDTVTSAA